MGMEHTELAVDSLWNPCPPSLFAFESTEDLRGDVAIIGQERAVRAIDFGVAVGSFGFNIFALGYAGTGRSTTIRTFLGHYADKQPVPSDWVYVHNFTDPNQPHAIGLSPGLAVEFRRDMQELLDDLIRDIPRAFESEDYERRREEIVRALSERRNALFAQLEHKVNERGFTLLKTAMGVGVAPVLNGQVLTPEAYQRLDEATRADIEQRQGMLQSLMAETMRSIREVEKDTKRTLQDLDRQIADSVVSQLVAELRARYADHMELAQYLDQLHADIVDSVEGFKSPDDQPEGFAAAMQANQREAWLRRYRVNVLVDQGLRSGAPVILEPNPTYGNLVGRIEHRSEFGTLVTDFTMIKAGALHRANGGYLIVEMRGLLANTLAWDALKRAIKNRQIRTEEIGAQTQLVSTVTLEPEPIPLDVKVVLIGDPETYYILHELDEDFGKLFKVQADFGTIFDRAPDTCQDYARFVAARCREESLLPFDRDAVARVVEYGSRLAADKQKLSARFGEIADLVRESSFWAAREGKSRTSRADVRRAVEERAFRASRNEDRMRELIRQGSIRVNVTGTQVGQVNGLSVFSLGNYAYGIPSRISVRTYSGKTGVVSIDREAKLSGRFHDKGLLTLTGYLGGKYALDRPMSLAASISFEQLYDEIEGDSASSAELYALLSSLSDAPLAQGLAVTGSVDQQGNVQPVGGINEKIEGFFDTCSQAGLTGSQGVLIPEANVRNLMLRTRVREAVQEGRFHIYPVRTVDQGLEILTGLQAGERYDQGGYPEGSLHRRVVSRLAEMADSLDRDSDRTTKGSTAGSSS